MLCMLRRSDSEPLDPEARYASVPISGRKPLFRDGPQLLRFAGAAMDHNPVRYARWDSGPKRGVGRLGPTASAGQADRTEFIATNLAAIHWRRPTARPLHPSFTVVLIAVGDATTERVAAMHE